MKVTSLGDIPSDCSCASSVTATVTCTPGATSLPSLVAANRSPSPVSHNKLPFGCRIKKHGTAISPGLPSYSPVSENPPMSLKLACPQSSTYSFNSVTCAAQGEVFSHRLMNSSAIGTDRGFACASIMQGSLLISYTRPM